MHPGYAAGDQRIRAGEGIAVFLGNLQSFFGVEEGLVGVSLQVRHAGQVYVGWGIAGIFVARHFQGCSGIL